jgi:hypothetical protein
VTRGGVARPPSGFAGVGKPCLDSLVTGSFCRIPSRGDGIGNSIRSLPAIQALSIVNSVGAA